MTALRELLGVSAESAEDLDIMIGVFGVLIAIIITLCLIGIDSDRRRKKRLMMMKRGEDQK